MGNLYLFLLHVHVFFMRTPNAILLRGRGGGGGCANIYRDLCRKSAAASAREWVTVGPDQWGASGRDLAVLITLASIRALCRPAASAADAGRGAVFPGDVRHACKRHSLNVAAGSLTQSHQHSQTRREENEEATGKKRRQRRKKREGRKLRNEDGRR